MSRTPNHFPELIDPADRLPALMDCRAEVGCLRRAVGEAAETSAAQLNAMREVVGLLAAGLTQSRAAATPAAAFLHLATVVEQAVSVLLKTLKGA